MITEFNFSSETHRLVWLRRGGLMVSLVAGVFMLGGCVFLEYDYDRRGGHYGHHDRGRHHRPAPDYCPPGRRYSSSQPNRSQRVVVDSRRSDDRSRHAERPRDRDRGREIVLTDSRQRAEPTTRQRPSTSQRQSRVNSHDESRSNRRVRLEPNHLASGEPYVPMGPSPEAPVQTLR